MSTSRQKSKTPKGSKGRHANKDTEISISDGKKSKPIKLYDADGTLVKKRVKGQKVYNKKGQRLIKKDGLIQLATPDKPKPKAKKKVQKTDDKSFSALAIIDRNEGTGNRFQYKNSAEVKADTSLSNREQRAIIKKLTQIKKLQSTFKVDSGNIQELISTGRADTAIVAFQKSMLRTVIDLIPQAEDKYRTSGNETSAYAMNSIISQARELINDIQSDDNRKQIGLNLCNQIIQPNFIKVVQNLVNAMHFMQQEVEALVPNNKRKELASIINKNTRSVVSHLQEVAETITEDTVEFMDDE